jgi:hypothetical protein
VVNHLQVVALQIGYPSGLDESRIDNSDDPHAPASLVSGFSHETQLAYDLGIHCPPAAIARARTAGRRLAPPPRSVAARVGRETGGGDPRPGDSGA